MPAPVNKLGPVSAIAICAAQDLNDELVFLLNHLDRGDIAQAEESAHRCAEIAALVLEYASRRGAHGNAITTKIFNSI